MHYIEYKNHIIYPTPRLQIGTGYWKTQLTLRFRNNIRMFTTENIFSTKNEALLHCIDYGKNLIDERVRLD